MHNKIYDTVTHNKHNKATLKGMNAITLDNISNNEASAKKLS